jgi:transposase
MTLACAAGIDAGKFFLDVAIVPSVDTFRVDNTDSGIDKIIKRLRRFDIQRVVLEAIGPYATAVTRALAAAGFAVGLVNPRRIKAFRDAEGRHAKTDQLDAQLIARFALHMTDALRPLPSQSQMETKALATRRRQLTEMIAMEKTRLKQASDRAIADSIRLTIAALKTQQRAVEEAIARALNNDPALVRRHDILTSIPGIGQQTATVLLTDLPELGALDRRAIASLAGVAPHPHQSGVGRGRNQISGGRPCVRTALYMAGLSAARSHPDLKGAYKLMREAGKPAKVAIIAIARKLLVIANALVKKNVAYHDEPPITAQSSFAE